MLNSKTGTGHRSKMQLHMIDDDMAVTIKYVSDIFAERGMLPPSFVETVSFDQVEPEHSKPPNFGLKRGLRGPVT